LARDKGHARLIAQIYAEAAVSPALGKIVERQLAMMRARVAELIPDSRTGEAEAIAEAFVAVSTGYSQQLAIRGDLDPAPFTKALAAILQAQDA
jgi:hypothetical protein